MRAGQIIAERCVLPWLEDEQARGEQEYRRVESRFANLANDFLKKLAESGVPAFALMPTALDSERGFRAPSRFTFELLLRVSLPASPLRYIADVVLGVVGASFIIERDAREFLDHLIDMNSARVQSDVLNRVQESRKQSSAFKDEVAQRFHDAIDYDWDKFESKSLHSRMMAVRTLILDTAVGSFLSRAPEGLIVNLGAGLDTRFYRLDYGMVRWIEVDLPGAISFRSRCDEPANERHQLVAGSVLEDGWIKEVNLDAKSKVLLIAEGPLPYFTEEEHRQIFSYLVAHFPGQEMLFQTMAPSLIEGLVQYSNLSKMSTNVEVKFGLDNSTQVSSLLDPRVRFVREFPLLEGRYDRLPDLIKRKLSPVQAMKVEKMVHVRFDGCFCSASFGREL